MQSAFRRLEAFSLAAGKARDTNALSAVVEREVGRLGFDFFTYWLRSAPSGRLVEFFFGNYPPGWAERYAERHYQTDDLILHRLRQTVLPFNWGSVDGARTTAGHRTMMNEAREHGLTSGAAAPVTGPGSARAHLVVSSSVGSAEVERLFAEHRYELFVIAAHVHERALELLDSPSDLGPIRLSPREFEILKWVVQGKTNWEIGEILTVSETTVKDHVRNICTKFGVNTRMQAAAIALYQGYMSL